MMSSHGPMRGPPPVGPAGGSHGSTPGGPSPLPGQQHPGMPQRGTTPGMPSPAGPSGGSMHSGNMHPGMRPPGMHTNADVSMSEPERIVIGHRVTVPNMDAANAAMRAGAAPPGYNALGAAAAAAAAAQGVNLAAAAAAARQQFPYSAQFPYDYAAMYGAEWQQLMQQQRAPGYAAAFGLDKHAKVRVDSLGLPAVRCVTVSIKCHQVSTHTLTRLQYRLSCGIRTIKDMKCLSKYTPQAYKAVA